MGSAWSRLSRACALFLAMTGLGACVAQPNPYAYNPPLAIGQPQPLPYSAGRRIAVLVPLTGGNASVGQSMVKGAQLATDDGPPQLQTQDTGGTPDGAARAAQAALAGGAGLILGPLTASETGAVAPVARAAGVPVLAFTSDRAQAQPGLWTMGITPAQQVRTLVLAVRAENKTRLAAVLPSNPFGDALADGLAEATTTLGLPPAQIARYQGGLPAVENALREVVGTPSPGVPGAALPPSPPPIDALLLGTTGDLTVQAIPLLNQYGLGPDRVRLLGTALWARDAARLSGIAGAWYAAPDPALRSVFEQRYTQRFGAPPTPFASIAFDSAGAARSAATPNGFDVNALLRLEGFAGADGVFVLLPDGRVRRGLAIFEIGPNGTHVRQPGPRSLNLPGS
ncbi:MAG: penicillin-binding protein activator [Acetobacteraceae bacterium]|nr:penicillin-binding protein activator [Acetobacteraceae bacterium]